MDLRSAMLLSEGSAGGRLWKVYRRMSDQMPYANLIAVVVESAGGRSVFEGGEDDRALDGGDVCLGRCGSEVAGRWWTVTVSQAVAALRVGERVEDLSDVPLYRAQEELRHVLHPAGDALCWEAELAGGRVIRGREAFERPTRPGRAATRGRRSRGD